MTITDQPPPLLLLQKKREKNRTTNEELPSRQEYDTVCLFADVSGFTALSEAMMLSDRGEGVEGLAKHLNSYFGQMVRIIASEGGDVFKVRNEKWIKRTKDDGKAAERIEGAERRGREEEFCHFFHN